MLKSCVIFTVEIYHASTIVYFSLFRRSSFSNHSASDSHYLAVCIARNQKEKILFKNCRQTAHHVVMQFGSKLDIGFTLVTVVIMITIIFRKEKVVLVEE